MQDSELNDFSTEYEQEPGKKPENTKEQIKTQEKDPASEKNKRLKGSAFTQTPSVDVLEGAARNQGWVPLDEWEDAGKDPTEWRPAEVFLERGTYFKTMSSQKREIDRLKTMVNELVKIQKNVRVDERNKVLEELKQQKLQAVEDDNFQAVADIDIKISEQTKKIATEDAEIKALESKVSEMDKAHLQELAVRFKQENPWFFENPEMREYADRIGKGYQSINKQAGPDEVIDHVVKQVRSKFPEYFNDNNDELQESVRTKQRGSKVGSSKMVTGLASQRGRKLGVRDLDSMHQEIFKRFVEVGAVKSEAEYIAQLNLDTQVTEYK